MTARVLGIFGDIVNSIANAFSSVAGWIGDLIGQYIDFFITVILKFVYEILKVFFLLLDFIQLVFRKMVGLDTVYLNDGTTSTNEDLALIFFRNENVINALIALMIVAVVMIFICTFVAIIKNHYAAQKADETSAGPIIGKAFKALFTMIFVPLVCYFGVYVSNGLLRTIDQATRINDSLSISGEVFVASAISANRARIDEDFAEKLENDSGINPDDLFKDDSNTQYSVTAKTAADKIDDAFASQLEYSATITASSDDYSFMFHQSSPGAITSFDYMNTDLVHVYYNLQKFNWLFAFASCFFIMATLLVAALGVIQRLFEITILFAVSPPFIALMPLDNGSAYKKWVSKFISNVVVMYGTVVALNFYFIIAPVLQSINLFGSAADIAKYGGVTCDLFNGIAHVLFIMCGSMMIKDFSSLITDLVGGGKALEARGNDVQGEIQKSAFKASDTVNKVSGAASGAAHKIKDYYSEENVEKRQAEKAAKTERKAENRARRREIGKAWNSGEVTAREAIKMNRRRKDQDRIDRGEKPTLVTRANRGLEGLTGKDRTSMSEAGEKIYQDLNAAVDARKETYTSGAVAQAKNDVGRLHVIKAYKAGRDVTTKAANTYHTDAKADRAEALAGAKNAQAESDKIKNETDKDIKDANNALNKSKTDLATAMNDLNNAGVDAAKVQAAREKIRKAQTEIAENENKIQEAEKKREEAERKTIIDSKDITKVKGTLKHKKKP